MWPQVQKPKKAKKQKPSALAQEVLKIEMRQTSQVVFDQAVRAITGTSTPKIRKIEIIWTVPEFAPLRRFAVAQLRLSNRQLCLLLENNNEEAVRNKAAKELLKRTATDEQLLVLIHTVHDRVQEELILAACWKLVEQATDPKILMEMTLDVNPAFMDGAEEKTAIMDAIVQKYLVLGGSDPEDLEQFLDFENVKGEWAVKVGERLLGQDCELSKLVTIVRCVPELAPRALKSLFEEGHEFRDADSLIEVASKHPALHEEVKAYYKRNIDKWKPEDHRKFIVKAPVLAEEAAKKLLSSSSGLAEIQFICEHLPAVAKKEVTRRFLEGKVWSTDAFGLCELAHEKWPDLFAAHAPDILFNLWSNCRTAESCDLPVWLPRLTAVVDSDRMKKCLLNLPACIWLSANSRHIITAYPELKIDLVYRIVDFLRENRMSPVTIEIFSEILAERRVLIPPKEEEGGKQ